ncbi:hypothetical protein JK159_02330 [Weissella minor]|uniref:hypothetical protein n=1 Tax=Weissella minor TaxID=1620 RepID=UPI001BAF246D|nr:hypothetical protein [Weissella minor]MBS0949220.1 hypothetical protein [Weissella minor]
MAKPKKRNMLQLIGYYFEFGKRAEKRAEENQKKYESMTYEELAAKYTVAEQKYAFTQRIYNLFKSVTLIAVLSFVFSILFNICVFVYQSSFKSAHMTDDQQKIAMIVVMISILMFITAFIIILVIINKIMSNQEADVQAIKDARDLKK